MTNPSKTDRSQIKLSCGILLLLILLWGPAHSESIPLELQRLAKTYKNFDAYSDSGKITDLRGNEFNRKFAYNKTKQTTEFLARGKRFERISHNGTFYEFDHERRLVRYRTLGSSIGVVQVGELETPNYHEDFIEEIGSVVTADLLNLLLAQKPVPDMFLGREFHLLSRDANQTVFRVEISAPDSSTFQQWYLVKHGDRHFLERIEFFVSSEVEPVLYWTAGKISLDKTTAKNVIDQYSETLEKLRTDENYDKDLHNDSGPGPTGTHVSNPDAPTLAGLLLSFYRKISGR